MIPSRSSQRPPNVSSDTANVVPLRPPGDPLRPYVARVLDGDRNALNPLLRQVAPALLRTARSVLGADHPDVEDALQDSLLRFVDALPAYRGDCAVIHYAVRIGVRAATDAVRKSERRHRLRHAVTEEHSTRSHATTMPEGFAQREVLARLLAVLTPVQSEVLLMKVAHGYSLDEIAEAVGAPRNTVRSRLLHARRALRARVEQDEELARLLEDEL